MDKHSVKTTSISEKRFLLRLKTLSEQALLYENQDLQESALQLIPDELHINATITLSLVEEENAENLKVDGQDCVLLELMNWFKTTFFKWIDVPSCNQCGETPTEKKMAPPTETEIQWYAHKVEAYVCKRCNIEIRFPRYNHPRKLLETRQGRCGEWANCFTLFCRSLKFESRIVADWNDHVWTEVWSRTKKKWLHCDPCENIIDKPLLYEAGWKKQMSYVIAFSGNDIQDVTWRYTSDFAKAMQNRKLCREEWLTQVLLTIRRDLQKEFSVKEKQLLNFRSACELAEMLTPPNPSEEALAGRTSGSLQWRLSRAETEMPKDSFVFKPYSSDIVEKHFLVKYCCATNKYNCNNKDTEDTWDSCTYGHRDVFRKVESDWKVAYLCRKEGATEAHISWKFDFSETGLTLDRIVLYLFGRTFNSAKIEWKLCTESEEMPISLTFTEDELSLDTDKVRGCNGFTLSARLSGGEGGCAFQHSQLFRQPLLPFKMDSSFYPFQVEAIFL